MRGSLRRGDVVLTRFPFTDLTGYALRPAPVISPGQLGADIVLAAISSVVRGPLAATDVLLEANDSEFAMTGLRVTSVIRLHKLATVELRVLARRLGRIGPQTQSEVDRLLRVVVGLDAA